MPHANSPPPAVPPTIDGVPLHVNDGLLAPDEVAPLRVSYPSEPMEVLRQRYETEGYVFLKGLLPRDEVLSARNSYFTSMAPSGVLAPGTTPVEGIFDPAASPKDYPSVGSGGDTMGANSKPGTTAKSADFVDAALKAHTEPWYCGSEDGSVRGLCNIPELLDFVAEFSGWGADMLPVKRTLLRNNTPGNKAIGVHYDQSFMRHGEPTAVTAWVPIGDVSLQGGGLIYLQDGETLGAEIEADFTRKAKAAGMSDEEMKYAFNKNMLSTGFLCDGPKDFGKKYGKKWLVTAYEAGDVVLHTPHMIHGSTVNNDPEGKIRLGTDLRFVNKTRPWDTRWNKHFTFGDGV
ncbi:hypothetical protein F5X99DRAFT_214897 [Biscogniauxia marginata]|nr:hypothetical protein F5X99DRAFT_214897 [Biscogniauxia marginata]